MSSPSNFSKLSVVTLSKDFRKATKVTTGHLPAEPPAGQVLVKVAYAGVNASDLNFTNGSYFKDTAPPFDCGFEAIGTVVAVGKGVAEAAALQAGQSVMFSQYGSFAEYIVVPAAICVPVPAAKPEYLVLLVSGLTAAISLAELGQPQKGEVALVTAAAGGTGQIAVQLLKRHYGCTVIGTCSSSEKATFLTSIGCDHVINYKKENLDARLQELAPNGVNVVYECVGGETFNTAARRLAVKGRLIMIGSISSYKSGEQVPFRDPSGMPLATLLLVRSAMIHGFFLPHFRELFAKNMSQLLTMVQSGAIKPTVEKTVFSGVAAVPDAVDLLYSGKSCGKIVVKIDK